MKKYNYIILLVIIVFSQIQTNAQDEQNTLTIPDGLKFERNLTTPNTTGATIDYIDAIFSADNLNFIDITPTLDKAKTNHFVINQDGTVIIGTDYTGAKDIGSTNPCGMLRVNGYTYLYDSLIVRNHALFNKNLTVNDSLIVNGEIKLNDLVVINNALFQSNLTVKDSLIVDGIAFRSDGSATFDIVSDEKLKKNFKNLDKQLPELLKIDLYSYDYKNTGITRYGIKAQEIQKVLPNSVKKFKKDYLSFNPNDLMYMHIRATQELAGKFSEQKTIVDELEKINEEQAGQISELTNMVDEMSDKYDQLLNLFASLQKDINANKITQVISTDSKKFSEAQLSQNNPNPSKGITTINYSIPKGVNSAWIEVYDLVGQILLSIPIEGAGAGSININIDDLGNDSNIYPYSLILDDQSTLTRKMVFVK